MKGSDKAFVWVCHDCSEEEPANEKFAIRLQNVENAEKFKEAFNDAKQFNIDIKNGKEPTMAPVIEDKEDEAPATTEKKEEPKASE